MYCFKTIQVLSETKTLTVCSIFLKQNEVKQTKTKKKKELVE